MKRTPIGSKKQVLGLRATTGEREQLKALAKLGGFKTLQAWFDNLKREQISGATRLRAPAPALPSKRWTTLSEMARLPEEPICAIAIDQVYSADRLLPPPTVQVQLPALSDFVVSAEGPVRQSIMLPPDMTPSFGQDITAYAKCACGWDWRGTGFKPRMPTECARCGRKFRQPGQPYWCKG